MVLINNNFVTHYNINPKERNSNFELLRIIAMFFIVIGHFIGQTHSIDTLVGTNKVIAEFLAFLLKISVNIFLFIGCWFMVDKPFKSSKIIDLYLQLWQYTFSLTVLFILLGFHISNFDIIRNVFPFSGKALWFVSTYLVLIALHPFLNKLFSLKRDILKKLLIILSIVIVYISTIQKFFDSWLDCVSWFVFVYLFIGYFKKYLYNKININKYLSLLLGLLIYFSLVVMNFHSNNTLLSTFASKSLLDIKTLPNVICSACIFYFFLKSNIGCNKIINYIAKSTLAVYIIHQTPGVKDILWYNIIQCEKWICSDLYILYVLLIPIILYLITICTEAIRTNYIMPLLKNFKLYKYIQNKIDKFYEPICLNRKEIENVR